MSGHKFNIQNTILYSLYTIQRILYYILWLYNKVYRICVKCLDTNSIHVYKIRYYIAYILYKEFLYNYII